MRYTKHRKKILQFFLFLSIILINNCAMAPINEAGYPKDGVVEVPEKFYDDTLIVEKKEPVNQIIDNRIHTSSSNQNQSEEFIRTVGWRVQIAATMNSDESERIQQEAESKFDYPIYIDYEQPYFKVRIGDCTSFEDTREILDEVRKTGYEDAFIVRTNILYREGRK